MLKAPPELSIAERVRAAFANLSEPMTINAFTHHCINTNVFTEEEQDLFQFQSVRNVVRTALKKRDELSMPFAGPTTDKEGNSPIWKQRAFWNFDTYALNVRTRLDQGDANYHEAYMLADECESKFGISPLAQQGPR